ncbi:MAG TPA: xanthine dehydrogenase family protein subunit M [Candidatus Latescibacteria bacterium]|nr:xanthine dehydrogenase family protein subunit M [Candidatus Latescibacterota bacterium]
MQAFDYVAVGSVREAVAALKNKKRVMVLAGGTDMLVRMKGRVLTPEVVVDVKGIPGAGDFSAKSGLSIGSAVTMRQVELSAKVREDYAAVAQGAAVVGSIQIRNLATVAGNICNAAPSADVAPGLIALRAKVRIAGPGGQRTLLVENFMTGPGKTALKRGELVTAIQLPTPGPRTGSAFVRHTPRGAMDIAVVNVAVAMTLAPRTGKCEDVRIVLGAVAPTPMRALKAEMLLRGEKLTADLVAEAAAVAGAEARPISDQRASAEFRRELVRVLTGRMVEAARADAGRSRARGRRA